ncbi:endonuclease/exonuclease/phosphatase family protein [Patescibacteria group bacterium]|nr:endonuclease/exonuclease/phosphatase family protein [Patescibacteria group bacterium]
MKIIVYNIAYGTGLNGAWKNYFLRWWRYLWAPKNTIKNMAEFLRKENPDVVCFLETDAGSLRSRFKNQMRVSSDGMELPFISSAFKYKPKSLRRIMPIMNKNHNGVLSKKQGKIVNHYLKKGAKKLVIEYINDGISIFIVHLSSFSGRARGKQLKEISSILKDCPRPYLVCGDFNTFKGVKEVEPLIKRHQLALAETGSTFPAHNPKYRLDLAMASKEITIKDSGVIQSHYSDHLPIYIEIE